MSWLKIDDGFAEHEKIIDLSDRAFRLHVAALCYCARNLTDGLLGERQLAAVCAITLSKPKHLAELVSAGLWEQNGSCYLINDYLDYNPTASKVKAERHAAKERMRSRRSSGERSVEQTAHVRVPRPVPSPKSTTAFVSQAVENSLRSAAG